jgi:hypothetical protein
VAGAAEPPFDSGRITGMRQICRPTPTWDHDRLSAAQPGITGGAGRCWEGRVAGQLRRLLVAQEVGIAISIVPQPFRIHWDAVLAQAAISGLFAVLRARHDADRSVGKVAAFLALPQ